MSDHKIPRIRALHWCTDQIMSGALAQMELTASQGCVLGYLNHQKQPPCPRDIEEAFNMSHSCTAGILCRLEKKGFIEFFPDEEDHRCKRIRLLPKSQECHALMHETILGIEKRMVQDFTDEEQAQFIRLLNRAIINMGGNPNSHYIKEEL